MCVHPKTPYSFTRAVLALVDIGFNMACVSLLLLTLSTSLCASAQYGHSDSIAVYFHQSKTDIDLDYHNNREVLSNAIKAIMERDSIAGGQSLRVTCVEVVGGASPEGSIRINERLSRRRAANIFSYVSEHIEMPDSITSHTFLGRDWHGLRNLVATDVNVPYRSETLSLIEDILAGNVAEPLVKLKKLRNGVPYNYMYWNLFPDLRKSMLVIRYAAVPDAFPTILPSEIVTTCPPYIPDSVGIILRDYSLPKVCSSERKPFYMDIRTNMLYDAALVPNIGVEFYIGKNFSILADWKYAWWGKPAAGTLWRIYGGGVTGRWWWNPKGDNKPLTGHHIGVYAGVITCDFCVNGKGYMGGLPQKPLWDRFHINAGIEYGYSLPISTRLNIDFSIGVGCMTGEVRHYEVKDTHSVWQKTVKKTWVGPSKGEISLVWLLGRGNYNNRKGGKK